MRILVKAVFSTCGWVLALPVLGQCRWTMPTAPLNLATAVWSGSQFVALGGDTGGKVVAVSTTGTDWTVTARYHDETHSQLLAWNGHELLGILAPQAWTSPDAVTWTLVTQSLWVVQPTFLTWAGDRYFAWVPPLWWGAGLLWSSVDGQHWTTATRPMAQVFRVAYTGTAFVAVGGYSPSVATSLDGNSWTGQPLPASVGSSAALSDVVWNGHLLVAVGLNGLIVTSTDGVAWRLEDSRASSSLYAVTATPDGFVTGGQDGTILASPDGVSWHRELTPTQGLILQLVTGGGRTLAIVAGDHFLVRSCESTPVVRRHVPRLP